MVDADIREQQLAAIVEVATRMAKRMGCTFVLDPVKVAQFLGTSAK